MKKKREISKILGDWKMCHKRDKAETQPGNMVKSYLNNIIREDTQDNVNMDDDSKN